MKLSERLFSTEGHSVLLHSGSANSVYVSEKDGESWEQVADQFWLESVFADVPLAYFDLQMPFIYWNKWEVAGTRRVLGRLAYLYDMYPDAEAASFFPEIGRVRLALDADFKAMLRADYFDHSGELIKSLRVLSFKEVFKQCDLR